MAGAPPELRDLLDAPGVDERESAWSRFVHRYSPVLLHAARSVTHEHDRAMDAYAHVLDQLRADDAQRLRRYANDARCQFTTWLVVVARRLSLDYLRQRYGRPARHDTERSDARATRRRLVDLLAEEIGPTSPLPDPGAAPDAVLRQGQLSTAVQVAVARLLPAQRLLLAMRFEDDRSARDIAQLLGYPTPFHVYRALNAVMGDLRKSLAQQGITDPEP